MANTLILMSDEHSRKVMGAYGNTLAHTPNLDALAARGTLFTSAYCNSPICVPSRASLHTGLFPHQIGHWDNAMPYDGRVKSWGHALQSAGRPVTSIGKLHFRNATDDTGFDQQILPLHVQDGIGDPTTLLRRDPPERPGTRQMAAMTGQGVTPYWDYDRSVALAAADWLRAQRKGSGWTVFVSLVMPHFPLNAPERFRALFDRDTFPLPKLNRDYSAENASIAAMRRLQNFQDHFDGDDAVREALAHYYALCAALDENVGLVLDALKDSGAEDDTVVIYTSDHGDNLGARGYWGKSTLWEESAGVPMVIAGPGIPEGRRNDTPVSLIDLYPTVLDIVGLPKAPDRPGDSLVELAGGDDPGRPVFAEYHAVGSPTGMFMLRLGRFKLIECAGDDPLLYDLADDPEETCNRATDPAFAEALTMCRAALHHFADPVSVSDAAFADQAALVERLGGEGAIRRIVPLAYTDPGAARPT
uniref:sulfatase-like hydrolase/transferase n=1 Tax=Pararhizobium sp. IMCC3301 TaxID=3067904 RepID=UPI0027406E98|nr:sulfatase-like hydrolase/transferase [Pararhizobium sp. IMCC3301]